MRIEILRQMTDEELDYQLQAMRSFLKQTINLSTLDDVFKPKIQICDDEIDKIIYVQQERNKGVE